MLVVLSAVSALVFFSLTWAIGRAVLDGRLGIREASFRYAFDDIVEPIVIGIMVSLVLLGLPTLVFCAAASILSKIL
jgi:hypothetical protein